MICAFNMTPNIIDNSCTINSTNNIILYIKSLFGYDSTF